MDELKSQPEAQLSVTPALGLTGLLFLTNDPLVGDVRIRGSIARSRDTAEIADVVMEATAKANNSALQIGTPYYGAVEAKGYVQNIAEAKKLLAEAGYHGQPIKMITNKRY